MMKKIGMFIVTILISAMLAGSAGAADVLEIRDSEAFKQYQLRKSDTELSKLIYLMDRYRDAKFEIQYDGSWYGADEAMMEARKYLRQNYKNEPAEKFIKLHTYRPYGKEKIIFIRFPNDEIRILRDVLLEELKRLDQVAAHPGVIK